MSSGLSMYGDWAKAGIVLKKLSVNLVPQAEVRLYENGKMVVKTMQDHIDKQDLPWAELAETTVRLKQDERIYIETGYLRDNIGIRKVRSSKDSTTYFVGASPWKKHPESGLKFSDLMIYMEYGTINQPPRPIIQPTYEEVKGKIKDDWRAYLKSVVKGAI